MTDAIDLTKKQHTILTTLVRRFLPGVAVWAYGSRVKWTARPNSDLDLVAFTTPAQGPQVADLKDALAESNLPFPVDLHVWDDVQDQFREIIRKEYVVVQETKEPERKASMPGEWNTAPLSALAELSGGFAFKSGDYAPSGRFILRTLNISDDGSINRDDAVYLPQELCPQYNRFELKAKDTLFVMVGATLGKVGFVREKDLPALLNQNMWLIRANPERADPRFVHYAFRHSVKESLGWASGSARDFVRRDDYRNLLILSPPLLEQRAIAHILGTLDDKIELNRRMNETLEAMARALFRSWFVDFDPVRAKAEGRDTGLPKYLADLFPDSFEVSELGEIPKGWRARFISDLTSNIQYGFTQSASSDLIGPRFLRITDIQGGKVDWSTVPFCEVSPEEHERYRLKPGDVLVARTGASTGENIYLSYAPDAVFASYLVRFQFPDVAIARLVGAFMRTQAYFEYVAGGIGGSAQPNASAQVLAGAQLVVPTPSIARMFSDLVAPLDLSIVANTHESHTLTALRNTLLPKLIAGELRVKDAERFMESAV